MRAAARGLWRGLVGAGEGAVKWWGLGHKRRVATIRDPPLGGLGALHRVASCLAEVGVQTLIVGGPSRGEHHAQHGAPSRRDELGRDDVEQVVNACAAGREGDARAAWVEPSNARWSCLGARRCRAMRLRREPHGLGRRKGVGGDRSPRHADIKVATAAGAPCAPPFPWESPRLALQSRTAQSCRAVTYLFDCRATALSSRLQPR
jgi:hypothetical protein